RRGGVGGGVGAGEGWAWKDAREWVGDVAFRIATLIAKGVVGSADEVARSLFFPVTGTSPNRHNKDWLLCPFLPLSTLSVDETVSPPSVASNVTTPVAYSIAVHADGRSARGVHLTQPALPGPFVTFVGLDISPNDPTVTVVSKHPLDLRIPELPAGQTLTVTIHANARFGCSDAGVSSSATAVATNAVSAGGTAALGNQMSAGVEICDGLDNNCDGQID